MKRKLSDGEPDFQNSEIVEYFFKQDPIDKNLWLCKCGKKRTQADKKGYSNLLNHIHTSHTGWKEELKDAKRSVGIIKYFLPSDEAKKIYGWLHWIITEGYFLIGIFFYCYCPFNPLDYR